MQHEPIDKFNRAVAFYRKFFLVAAIWNVGGGVLGIVSVTFSLKLFYNVTNYPADALFKFHYYNFWLFILFLGFGYYIVSRNVLQNYATALVGIFGKTVLAGFWLYYYLSGQATVMVIVAGGGDMLFVLGFIMYLTFMLKNFRNGKLQKN
ncbi:MAG: hypothetical protein JWR18_1828 [Segetibacter sp.]|jgi:hypothetical protein|nr:hypothetical protein [Segetibacter sp.]